MKDSFTDATGTAPDILFGRKLVLWLDASQAGTVSILDGSVDKWVDRINSARAVNAAPPWQNNVGLESDAAGGRPAVRVGMTNGLLESNNVAPPDLICDFVIVIIASFSNASEAVLFQQGEPGTGVFILTKPNGAVFGGLSNFGVTTAAAWNDGAFHSFGMRCAIQGGTNMVSVRADGNELSATGNQSGPSQTRFVIGGDYCKSCEAGAPISRSLDGRVAEILVAINTSGSTSEIAELSAYFQKKYGIPF